jgi:hypothetical protein
MTSDTPKKLKRVVAAMVEILVAHVESSLPENQWKCGRFSNWGSASKLRIDTEDETIAKLYVPKGPNGKFFDLLDKIRDLNEKASEKWHGLTIIFFPDKTSKLEFRYEEEWPGFFMS